MSNKKINVAVIGTGHIGRHHVRNYSELACSRLVAICDLNQKIGKKLAQQYHCKFYHDYQKMLDTEPIEAISIAVPTKLHKTVALDVIKKKINVLIEKPIASTTKSAKQIIEAAQKNGIKLTVGHIERFNPAVTALKQMIKQGKLGKITSIIAKRVGPFISRIKDSGVLIDLAVHDIDIINHLLEKKPTKIYANGGRAIGRRREDHEDYADIFLNYDGSTSGYIQANWITPVIIRELHVTGTKGYAQLNYITQELNFYKSTYKKGYDDYGDFVIKFGTPQKISIPVTNEEPLKLELKAFLESIQKNIQPQITGNDALDALEISLKALNNMT